MKTGTQWQENWSDCRKKTAEAIASNRPKTHVGEFGVRIVVDTLPTFFFFNSCLITELTNSLVVGAKSILSSRHSPQLDKKSPTCYRPHNYQSKQPDEEINPG
jgi:hypothetical protein